MLSVRICYDRHDNPIKPVRVRGLMCGKNLSCDSFVEADLVMAEPVIESATSVEGYAEYALWYREDQQEQQAVIDQAVNILYQLFEKYNLRLNKGEAGKCKSTIG